jgi:hypothetical protein
MLEGAELAETLAAGPRTWTGPSAPSRRRTWARAARRARITAAGLHRLVSPGLAAALALFDEVQPS